MEDPELHSADGLVIVQVNIDNDDRREQVVHRITNLPSDEVTETLFEIHTSDWDDGLWDEEIVFFHRVTVWQ